MENENITELLHASFHRQLSAEEKDLLEHALQEDESLRVEKEEIRKMIHTLGSLNPRFREGFSDRVMNRINKVKGKVIEVDFSDQLFMFFKRIVFTGVAAIIILLISIYLTNGSLSKESVLGMQSMSDDNLVSYLLYEE